MFWCVVWNFSVKKNLCESFTHFPKCSEHVCPSQCTWHWIRLWVCCRGVCPVFLTRLRYRISRLRPNPGPEPSVPRLPTENKVCIAQQSTTEKPHGVWSPARLKVRLRWHLLGRMGITRLDKVDLVSPVRPKMWPPGTSSGSHLHATDNVHFHTSHIQVKYKREPSTVLAQANSPIPVLSDCDDVYSKSRGEGKCL